MQERFRRLSSYLFVEYSDVLVQHDSMCFLNSRKLFSDYGCEYKWSQGCLIQVPCFAPCVSLPFSEANNVITAAKVKLNPEGPFPQHNIEMRRLAGVGMCYIQGGEHGVGCSGRGWLLHRRDSAFLNFRFYSAMIALFLFFAFFSR